MSCRLIVATIFSAVLMAAAARPTGPAGPTPNDRTISDLRTELDQTKREAAGRFNAMASAKDGMIRDLQAQADQARVEKQAWVTVDGVHQSVITSLKAEMARLKTDRDDTSRSLQAISRESAARTEALARRHEKDTAQALNKAADIVIDQAHQTETHTRAREQHQEEALAAFTRTLASTDENAVASMRLQVLVGLVAFLQLVILYNFRGSRR